MASGKDSEPEAKKIATFLWLAGSKVTEIYSTLFPNDGTAHGMVGTMVTSSDPSTSAAVVSRTLEDVLKAFDDYSIPFRNITMESYKFNNIVQTEGQPFIEFETQLRKQYCKQQKKRVDNNNYNSSNRRVDNNNISNKRVDNNNYKSKQIDVDRKQTAGAGSEPERLRSRLGLIGGKEKTRIKSLPKEEGRRHRAESCTVDQGSKKDEEKPTKTEAPAKTKPSKALNAKLEQQARLEEEAEAERLANLSPEDKLAEKLRLQKIQEASDLKHAQDAFGVTSTSGGLDAFNPESKEEFKEFGATISWKVAQFRESEHFPQFVEDLVRSLCVNLSAADIKRVEMTVEILHSEKLKQGPEVRGIHGSSSILKFILG
ncbi:eukaryotic translation initiation factor 3 subunit J-like [Drosophila suzukii]|uniref:Eukaryotic translation initiation factor 3 subunit J-like n=2 Tax=Drosophila suzukii TaxID=28584 RepID=A0ABM4TVQ2_DROSZ